MSSINEAEQARLLGSNRPITSRLVWQETQHQKLFKLLDALADDLDVSVVLAELQHYADDHFSVEEAYMELLEYPKINEHRQAHEQFRQALKRFSEDTCATEDLRSATAMYLREWLTRHIYRIDRDLESFIIASEVK